MKKLILLSFLFISVFNYSQNLVTNGGFENWPFPSTPANWSSASDFGDFSQNTSDFTEGSSSILFSTFPNAELFLFTTADIPLEAGKTYDVEYSYKYISTGFDANDNITFRIISGPTVSNPFVNTVNIQNNDWNTVQFQFNPTITDSDYAVEIYMQGEPSDFGNYEVLFDDVKITENTTLSTTNFDLDQSVSLIRIDDKVEVIKPVNINIEEASVFSILGTKQKIEASEGFSEFDVSNLASGLYIFKIYTNNGVLTKKLIIK
ncbi:T9SS type A sorting domain-containing protein [Lacinutrix salivirga]